MAARALFTNILKLNAENRESRLRQWLQWWKIAIMSERREKKNYQTGGFWEEVVGRHGHRQLSGTEGSMEKAASDRWGRTPQAAKSTYVTESWWASKTWGIRVQYRKGQEAHPNWQLQGMWSASKRDFTSSILDRLGSKTSIHKNLMRTALNAREEKTTKSGSGDQKGYFQVPFN